MKEDAIISALIGLAGACGNNPKTANTDYLVMQALAFPVLCSRCDDSALQELVDSIHSEKYTIAPGCAVCTAPCGNTSDYDMRRLYEANDAVRNAKLQVLARLQNLAAEVCLCWREGEGLPIDADFFYKALSYVGCDIEEAALLALLNEADEIQDPIKEVSIK